MAKKYPISSYNKHICLKANELMLISCVYLLKPFIIEISSLANKKDRSELVNLFYADKLQLLYEAIAAVPMMFLFYAWINRTLDASNFVEHIWRNGKAIIYVVSLLQLSIAMSPLWLQLEDGMTMFDWIQCVIYIGIILTIYKSVYITDCFADFPENSNQND